MLTKWQLVCYFYVGSLALRCAEFIKQKLGNI
jgi:hypothetical protein